MPKVLDHYDKLIAREREAAAEVVRLNNATFERTMNTIANSHERVGEKLDIGAGSESWRIQMGQQGAVDATGTAAFLQGLVNALVTQSAENGQRVLELQSMQTLIAQYEATLKNMQAQLNELRARSAPVPPVEIPR